MGGGGDQAFARTARGLPVGRYVLQRAQPSTEGAVLPPRRGRSTVVLKPAFSVSSDLEKTPSKSGRADRGRRVTSFPRTYARTYQVSKSACSQDADRSTNLGHLHNNQDCQQLQLSARIFYSPVHEVRGRPATIKPT